MNGSNRWKEYLRSTHGQVSLFAITFAGAVVLALVSIAVRSIFFERFVRENYPTPDSRLIKVIEKIAGGAAPDKQEQFTGSELDQIYGAWISESFPDPDGVAADYLLQNYDRDVLDRIRGTFVAGNLAQKTRAIELIQHLTNQKLHPEAVELCEFLHERATRRNETNLKKRIEAVIRLLTAAN